MNIHLKLLSKILEQSNILHIKSFQNNTMENRRLRFICLNMNEDIVYLKLFGYMHLSDFLIMIFLHLFSNYMFDCHVLLTNLSKPCLNTLQISLYTYLWNFFSLQVM